LAGGRPLTDDALASAAWRRLARRLDVRTAAAVAKETGDAVLLTGGAVRDAFLAALDPERARGPRSDLDVVLAAGRALAFAEALGRRFGTRAIGIGAPERRVLHVPLPHGEVDVWARDGEVARDLLRRDFTVNALAFELPAGRFLAPPGSLSDLRRRRLAPPRPGVFLEDPLRVLRAARFLARLPGFRIAPSAIRELRRAAVHLGTVAAERRLYELDRILSAPPKGAARALRFLERTGALAGLLRGSTARQRRRGLDLVGRLLRPSPAVARSLLLQPLGKRRAEEILRSWKASRKELQLSKNLLTVVAPAAGPRLAARPTRREAVAMLRAVSPYFDEAVLFLSSQRDVRSQRLAASLASLSADPRRRARILRPRRPLDAVAFARALGIPDGPRLGAVLGELDLSLAAGEVRGRGPAERLLCALTGHREPPSR
jgi:tRNA nucleotidyltransferase/poly(A) polymerase